MITIGILALQGDFEKHKEHLIKLKVNTRIIKNSEDLKGLDGLILPGGESTTIGKLSVRFNLIEPIKEMIQKGLPVFGTCAGAILLAKGIEGPEQIKFGVMDITITRNAYGRQVDSFETDINIDAISEHPLRCVFIRAPIISKTGINVKIIGKYKSNPILVQENNMLAGTFHPELTENLAVHEYFLNIIRK